MVEKWQAANYSQLYRLRQKYKALVLAEKVKLLEKVLFDAHMLNAKDIIETTNKLAEFKAKMVMKKYIENKETLDDL